MKMSKLYMPTLKEVPSEAEIASHKLLIRSGMVRRLVSGIYSFLPLGYRVIKKIEDVVREEMDRAGAQEMLMSVVQPRKLWEASGRWDGFGPEMFKLKDRHDNEFCLGPTHEEYFTDLIKDEVRSYKQLPLSLYQIQTKYRDEKRPRFGLIRSREFIMKDAYSFDTDKLGMENSYDIMWQAYEKIFDRLNLDYKIVEGDSGTMGGNKSHEFMTMSESGEGLVAYCNSCNYAATDEKAEVVYDLVVEDEKELEKEEVHTPNMKTIEDVANFLDIKPDKLAKAIIYKIKDEPIIALIPGNRELNESKLCNYLKIAEHELEIADDELIEKATGSKAGFIGPLGLKEGVKLLVDSRITKVENIVVGANKTDYHIKNVNYGRDFTGEVIDDLLKVEEGDLCPKCRKPLSLDRGIKVGNIFQLGKKYSESIGASYIDENGRGKHFYMGSYGIGISRLISAIVEQNHDEFGIIWPLIVAPYQVVITIINTKNEEQKILGEKIYEKLKDLGVEVLLDDRNERAGVKFNDRDLIGIPIRVTVGKKAKEGVVEYSLRKEGENIDIEAEKLGEKVLDELKNIR